MLFCTVPYYSVLFCVVPCCKTTARSDSSELNRLTSFSPEQKTWLLFQFFQNSVILPYCSDGFLREHEKVFTWMHFFQLCRLHFLLHDRVKTRRCFLQGSKSSQEKIKWQHSLISVTFPQLHVQYSYSEKLKPLDTQAQSSSINVEELEMSLSTMGSRYGRARMKQEGGDTEMVDLT